MTGAGGFYVPVSGDARGCKAEADGGGEEALAEEVVGEPVEAGQDVRWAEAVVAVTADSHAEPAHCRRSSQVVTGDITDGSEDRPRRGLRYVVPVSADLRPDVGWLVDRGQVEAIDVRQGGEQIALQSHSDSASWS